MQKKKVFLGITTLVLIGFFVLLGVHILNGEDDNSKKENSNLQLSKFSSSLQEDIYSDLKLCEVLDDKALLQKCQENTDSPLDCTKSYVTRAILVAGCQDQVIDKKKMLGFVIITMALCEIIVFGQLQKLLKIFLFV